jgi:hypothetical protein
MNRAQGKPNPAPQEGVVWYEDGDCSAWVVQCSVADCDRHQAIVKEEDEPGGVTIMEVAQLGWQLTDRNLTDPKWICPSHSTAGVECHSRVLKNVSELFRAIRAECDRLHIDSSIVSVDAPLTDDNEEGWWCGFTTETLEEALESKVDQAGFAASTLEGALEALLQSLKVM